MYHSVRSRATASRPQWYSCSFKHGRPTSNDVCTFPPTARARNVDSKPTPEARNHERQCTALGTVLQDYAVRMHSQLRHDPLPSRCLKLKIIADAFRQDSGSCDGSGPLPSTPARGGMQYPSFQGNEGKCDTTLTRTLLVCSGAFDRRPYRSQLKGVYAGMDHWHMPKVA